MITTHRNVRRARRYEGLRAYFVERVSVAEAGARVGYTRASSDALDLLAAEGPALGRPIIDRVKGSSLHHLKELRPGSARASEIRILFAFDPGSNAVLLVAGDKAGSRRRWYTNAIPLAEQRFNEWIKEAGA